MFTKSTFLSLFTIAIATTSASASCAYGTTAHTLMRRAGKELNYHYNAEGGPLTWGFIDPNYSTCYTGRTQSPIILDSSVAMAEGAPAFNISSEGAPVNNLGTTSMNVGAKGKTVFGGREYELVQFHFHTPSEHRIESEYYPVEMHMVHQGTDNSLVVFTVMFDLSSNATTPLASAVLPQNLQSGTNTTGPLDFTPVVEAFQSSPAYQYTGSFTTPPCTEGVTFVVSTNPLPIDVDTYNGLKKMLKFNSRYTESAPGRENLLKIVADNINNCTASTQKEGLSISGI
ncbi:hypothetical protein PQX77_002162 [Marasmius sp. AFHP31]|nr:hypothetical protein PQX77_002162 [Marasmius sp. AFHP31]